MKTVTVKLTIDQWEDKTTLEALGYLNRYYEMDQVEKLRNKISGIDPDDLPDDFSNVLEELYSDAQALFDTQEESQGIFDNSQIEEIVEEVFEQARTQ